jgi:flagellar biogenesis protein FliO
MGYGNFLQKAETFCGQYGLTLAQAVCILSAIVGLVCFLRRFRLSRKSLFSPHKLKIVESKSLGNRQFLLVVSYESEKLLLGVYPNGMRFLSKLGMDKNSASKTEPQH